MSPKLRILKSDPLRTDAILYIFSRICDFRKILFETQYVTTVNNGQTSKNLEFRKLKMSGTICTETLRMQMLHAVQCIRRPVPNGRESTYVQITVCCHECSIEAAEALVRWQSKT